MINTTSPTPQGHRTLPDDSTSLTKPADVGHVHRLPSLAIQHIASKLALPDLLSFRQTCHQVNSCIGSRLISKAKDKSYYKFKFLSQTSKEKHDKTCKELTGFLNGTLHSQAGNIDVIHKGEMCIKSEELEVVNIDATDNKDIFYLGTLSNGKKFTFIAAGFYENNGSNKLMYKIGYQEIYAGDSYKEIIQLIQDSRSDALPRHVKHLLSHERIYY